MRAPTRCWERTSEPVISPTSRASTRSGRCRGDLRAGEGGGQGLLVAGPGTPGRAAATPDDDDVDAAEGVQVGDPGRDLPGGAAALHARGGEHDRQPREAPADDAQDVAD